MLFKNTQASLYIFKKPRSSTAPSTRTTQKVKQFYCFSFWVAPLWKTGGQLENINRSVKHYLPETYSKLH
jgi:hypothetical protein